MRNIKVINNSWLFSKNAKSAPSNLPTDWEALDLPFTWNGKDGQDGGNDYYRGTCYFAKEIKADELPEGEVKYLQFDGVNSSCEIFWNGKSITKHDGGYSTFRAEIKDIKDVNLLVVAVDNSANDRVYPQQADFTFYGGIYRDVNIISVPNAHFDLEYYGGPGIMVAPKPTECGGATFEIESWVKNADENFTVQYSIFDEEGEEVGYAVRPADATKTTIFVPDANLWDFDEPYLYTVVAELQRRNETYDDLEVTVGVREFKCDPQEGFSINGVPTPLRGVSRHQDVMYLGNALTREEHFDDAYLIKELGANTIRLAHYQHSQDFYDACDELGFAIWAEIPFISVMSKNPAAHQNCIEQMKELIIQNYNHPSIMFWGVSNEILIGGISEQLVENHKELNALAKELDPTRLTTIAHVSFTPVDGPMHYITDTESYNHYFGWYGGKMEDNGPWLDNFHEKHPGICLGVSEYGCEGIITYHGPEPKCKDYSEDYQAMYHEHMAKVLDERPWIWSSHVWNMFDFGCAARDEGGVAGRNNKGLITMDRKTKKDSYYIYKAYWNPEPMVHLCGKRYAQRAGEEREIKVYTNQDSVTLYMNGEEVGTQAPVDHIAIFTVNMKDGENIFLAVAGEVKDTMTIEKVEVEPEIYVLPGQDEGEGGAANWFVAEGDVDLEDDSPMEFPEGKLSIKSTIGQIYKNEAAWEFFSKMTQGKVGPDMPMWGMMENFAVEMMLGMAGNLPESAIKALNKQLNQFDVVE